MAGVTRAVPLAHDSLDSSVWLHETLLDSTGTPDMDVSTWLRDLGLDRYEAAFHENAIDAEVLPELTDADLEKLGVLLGHRKRLLKAIATLQAGEAAPAAFAKSPVQAPP